MDSAASWLARLKAVECPDATFPSRDPAVVFDTAHGSQIRSVDGRTYIDLCAGFGALPLGHNSGPMREALAVRAEDAFVPIAHGMGDVFASKPKVALLELLISHLPSHLTHGSLALSGSQAVEIAVKTAMLKTGKHGFIVFEDGYHGVELGILPLTARDDFRAPFAGWQREGLVKRLPYGCDPVDIRRAIEDLESTGGPGFAGMCVEPVQGRGGVVAATSEWLVRSCEQTQKAGGLFILDEVFVGLFRTGQMSSSFQVPADVICLGKALGGGMPLSACVGSSEAMMAWPKSEGEAIHTGTFFGHPLSCDVGLRTLTALVSQGWREHVRDHGQMWLETLRSRFKGHRLVRDVRGMGYMWAMEFAEAGMGARLADHLRELGVIALPSGDCGQSLSLTPAFNIDAHLLTQAIDLIEEATRRL